MSHAKGIKKLFEFQDGFFNAVTKAGKKMFTGNLDDELKSKSDQPVSFKVDFGLLINEISVLAKGQDLIKEIFEELDSDFKNLFKSKNYDEFVTYFEELIEIDTLKKVPDVLRDIIHMEVGLTLSFIVALKNFRQLKIDDYLDSFNQYFFSKNGYRTVSGDLIVRPKFPKISSVSKITDIGNQINAERYIRDMTRIMGETTGDGLYSLRNRYDELSAKYKEKSRKKLVDWYDSFGDLAEASLLPVVESTINGALNLRVNPLVAAAVGTFCSVTTRKATEHSYLTLLGI
jgi:hypothetical protein